MSDLESRFRQAAEEAQKLPERPDNDTLLKLYAFYKQGSEGDVSGRSRAFSILSASPSTKPGKRFRACLGKKRCRNTSISSSP
jgi:hypothetical protein